MLAEVSKMTPDGLPVLLIDNAPPEIKTPSLKLTRPEIYYGEVTHEPVFVNTAQKEFNYPSGEQNAYSRYEGKGGFPISSFAMRLAAAINEGEPNILLTNYLTPNSRMMIHRKVRDRLQYAGRLSAVGLGPVHGDYRRRPPGLDGRRLHHFRRASLLARGERPGYGQRELHPQRREGHGGRLRRRNASLHLRARRSHHRRVPAGCFPDLFLPASEMPADLRRHARYPETLFRIQAEIYRTYHMLDPQSFYNKEDVWDLALHSSGQDNGPAPVTPTYMMATLPGESKPEFLLMMPFTPRNKNNLIGLMAARCDGNHLGDMWCCCCPSSN